METTTFETAKVGDRVWSITNGWGKVIRIDHGFDYPLIVKNDVGWCNSYTFCGYFIKAHAMQILFWDEVKIEAPQKPLPELEVDTKVLVWKNPNEKHKRHFSHFKNGTIYTFDSGATSFSKLHENSITPWSYWELAE